MTKSLARYDNTCKKNNRIQRRVYNDETAYNDTRLEFFLIGYNDKVRR